MLFQMPLNHIPVEPALNRVVLRDWNLICLLDSNLFSVDINQDTA